uniref:Uncharacterized protein n=1 Tax=viral metagenome TaxID=1070528 RepID=A0A6C0HYQ5_9ZZZZ
MWFAEDQMMKIYLVRRGPNDENLFGSQRTK